MPAAIKKLPVMVFCILMAFLFFMIDFSLDAKEEYPVITIISTKEIVVSIIINYFHLGLKIVG